jgi:hypothetical protein
LLFLLIALSALCVLITPIRNLFFKPIEPSTPTERPSEFGPSDNKNKNHKITLTWEDEYTNSLRKLLMYAEDNFDGIKETINSSNCTWETKFAIKGLPYHDSSIHTETNDPSCTMYADWPLGNANFVDARELYDQVTSATTNYLIPMGWSFEISTNVHQVSDTKSWSYEGTSANRRLQISVELEEYKTGPSNTELTILISKYDEPLAPDN